MRRGRGNNIYVMILLLYYYYGSITMSFNITQIFLLCYVITETLIKPRLGILLSKEVTLIGLLYRSQEFYLLSRDWFVQTCSVQSFQLIIFIFISVIWFIILMGCTLIPTSRQLTP